MAHDPRQCSTQTLDAYRTRSPRGSAVIAGAFGLTGCPERGVTVDVGDQADPPVFDVVELLRLVVEAGDLLYGADWTSVPDVARWTEAKRQALS